MGDQRWETIPLATIGDLRDLLGLTTSNLMWFADPKQWERINAGARAGHYRYRWAPKRAGGFRLIEEPKAMLKHFQRVVLREILNAVPAHSAAHGFRKGRSAVTYAAGHSGRAVLIHLDL